MKQSKFLTRCIALALALVLLATSANLGAALKVFAAEGDKITVTAGELVANNYELTGPEKALLKSGYLVGGTYTYDVPTDSELVTVDTENKTITAEAFGKWVPTTAQIVVGEEVKETIKVGEKYTFDGNAFAVKVAYELTETVNGQEVLLAAAANLKNALAEMNRVYTETDSKLGTIVAAMPTLLDVAAGIKLDLGILSKEIRFEEPAQNAVAALNAQLGAGDDQLDMQDMNAAYAQAASKVQFLVENGAAYLATIKATYELLNTIENDPYLNNDNIDLYLEINDPSALTKWKAFKDILSNTVKGLAAATVWNAESVAAGLTAADYVALDALVAAVETTSAPAVKNPLAVATVNVQKNLSMFNVAVSVKLVTVEDNALTENEHVETVVVTLGKNATADEILAAVAASGVEAKALAAWGEAYVAGAYTAETTALPEALTEDAEYVITYKPNYYNVGGETLPYGYELKLESHANENMAYDYVINGVKYEQGSVYTVVGDAEIVRTEGKAYSVTDLYTVLANNFGSDVMKEILKSGALTGNETIKVRMPALADIAAELMGGKLTVAASYPASYAGLNWAPLTYTDANGDPNLFTGNSATGVGKTTKVKYILALSNFSNEKVNGILNGAASLVTDSINQIAALDRLLGHRDAMGSLNKTKLGALDGTINVTDLSTDPEKNAALKAEFKEIVAAMLANNIDGNDLRIYKMLTEYMNETTGGLTYYYGNAKAVKDEITNLSNYLNGLVGDAEKEAAMAILCDAAGFPEYVDKIVDLGTVMKEVDEQLTLPSNMIDLESKSLSKLIAVLEKGEAAGFVPAEAPATLVSNELVVLDESSASIQLIITAGNEEHSFSIETEIGKPLTQDQYADLQTAVHMTGEMNLGANKKFYTPVGYDKIPEVGTVLTKETRYTTIYITYEPIEYKVEVEGGETYDVSIEDTSITLPGHNEVGYVYEYTLFGSVISVKYGETKKISLTPAQLEQIVDGTYTVAQKEIHQAAEDLEDTMESFEVLSMTRDENGTITGIVANLAPEKDSFAKLATEMLDIGYSYIEVNNETLLEVVEGTQIWLQTLINAILNDNGFTSQRMIELGKNNGGVLANTTMNLGNGKDELILKNIPFTLNLTSVPADYLKVSNGLDAVKNYMTFNSQDGVMNVVLDLPEKVYEIYLTALLASGELKKTDMNAINNEIAFRFLYDYIEYVIKSDATAQSFQNSLDMLYNVAGVVVDENQLPEIDLVAYSAYYDQLKAALVNENVKVTTDAENPVVIDINATGKAAIDGLMKLVGLDPNAFAMQTEMVGDYKNGNKLTVQVIGSLTDTQTKFEAAVLDISALVAGAKDLYNDPTKAELVALGQGKGLANGIDYTSNLAQRMSEVKGNAVIILLDDVKGDVVLNAGTIIDLNGHTIDGDLIAKNHLYIFDSTLSTADCGGVTGKVTGSGRIVAGNYPNCNVESFLRDGYYQNENGAVVNVLFTVETNGIDVTYVLNSDYMYDNAHIDGYLPSITTMAADIALDYALNYYIRAALAIDGAEIYRVSFDEILGILNSDRKVYDIVAEFVDLINARGIASFANAVLHDMLNFREMYNALKNDEVIGDYKFTVSPWTVAVKYVPETDHVDMGIAASTDKALDEHYNVGLKIVGENKDAFLQLLCELRDILSLDVTLDLKKPVYNAEDNYLAVAGNASATLTADLGMSCTYSRLDYIKIIAVLMDNGNNDANSNAMIEALNANDVDAAKVAFDKMTVEDLFTAAKVLNKPDDFKALAAEAGLNLTVAEANHLEGLWHLIITGTGKILEKFDITGINAQLGNLDDNFDGTYVLDVTLSKRADATVKGYTADVDVEFITLALEIVIFEPDCLIGDVNHDGKINPKDAQMILQYYVGKLPSDMFFCKRGADVDGNGKINPKDAQYILQYYVAKITKFPAQK